MKATDYYDTLNLSPSERERAFAVERDRILAAGSEARTVLLSLESYFDQKESEHFEAFKRLPLGATLEQYQTVHSSVIALVELKKTLLNKIVMAERVANEPQPEPVDQNESPNQESSYVEPNI